MCGKSKRGLRTVSYLIILGLTGCANTYLYRADDDKLAQSASKAIQDSGLKTALVAERVAMADRHKKKQDSVKRMYTALRDAQLARIVGGRSADYTWNTLSTEISNRLTSLVGEPVAGSPHPAQLLDDARQHSSVTLSRLELERDNYAILLAGKGIFTAPQCSPKGVTPLPAMNQDDDWKSVFGHFKNTCDRYLKARDSLNAVPKDKSALKAIDNSIKAIEDEKAAIDARVTDLNSLYTTELGKTKAERDPGKITLAAVRLKGQLDQFDQVTTKVADLTSNPILSKLVEKAQIEKLTRQKESIERLLEALQGKEPDAANAEYIEVYYLANLGNALTAGPPPPITAYMLQAELYRLQVAAAKQRLTRADEHIALLKKKRSAVQDEAIFLNDARKYFTDADKKKCAKDKSFFQNYARASLDCRSDIARAMVAYVNAWTLGRLQTELIDYQLIAQIEDAALDESESGIAQTEAVVRIATEQVAKLYAGGIKPEEITNLIQAFGFSAIAINVK